MRVIDRPGLLLRLMLMALLLAGCASRQPELEAPRVRVVEVDVPARLLRMRIDNAVPLPLPTRGARLELSIDGAALGTFDPPLAVTIPPLDSELLEFPLDPASPGAERLGDGLLSRYRYRVTGELRTTDGDVLVLDSEGWLSPTPGKRGSFR